MGVGAGLYMYDVVVKSSHSLSHLLMSSCYILHLPTARWYSVWVLALEMKRMMSFPAVNMTGYVRDYPGWHQEQHLAIKILNQELVGIWRQLLVLKCIRGIGFDFTLFCLGSVFRVSSLPLMLLVAHVGCKAVRIGLLHFQPKVIKRNQTWLQVFLYFHPVVHSSFFFLSSPNLSGRRLDVCHTSTHGVALVRI